MRLELGRSGEVFGSRRRRLALRLRPERCAPFAGVPGAQTIELAIGAQQGFLGSVFGVSRVAQDAASHAIGERAALGEALLELAPRVSLGRSLLQLIPDRATWLDQNQLLHLLSCASLERA